MALLDKIIDWVMSPIPCVIGVALLIFLSSTCFYWARQTTDKADCTYLGGTVEVLPSGKILCNGGKK